MFILEFHRNVRRFIWEFHGNVGRFVMVVLMSTKERTDRKAEL